ncbi:MFS transporter [Solirubrobacter taibaiensis]|nr:MFS transporter [Solirubrobacter taibaiensis]
MSSSYRAVFALPGARSLALSCGLGWLSFASYGLALVLALEAATGSFAVAGGAVAAFSAASALLAPARGRLVDRRGARALPWFAAVHALASELVVLGCMASLHPVLLLAAAGAAGASVPPLIATARAVWPTITGPELARAGHAVNAALGDAGQVIGPALTGGIAVLVSPLVALAVLAPGVVIGSILIAARAPDGAGPVVRPAEHRVWGVLGESPALRAVVLCELLLGGSFGALDVAAPVVAAEAGAAELAAIPLAAFAVGSVAMSIWSGTARLDKPAASRYVLGCVVVAVALLACLVTTTLAGLTIVLVGAGLGYGLLNVAVFELLEQIVAQDRAVEAFTWLTTWAGVGLAAGAIVAGQLSGAGPARTLASVSIPALLAAGVAVGAGPRLLGPDRRAR